MENLALVSSPKMVLGCSANPKDMASCRYPFGLPLLFRSRTTRIGLNRSATSISALSRHQDNRARGPLRLPKTNVLEKLGRECFASISSSSSQETSSVGVNPQLAGAPPPSHFGSPLFWVGVGVGLSALFSLVATNLKKYAMQQAFKTMIGQMDSQNNQFNNAAFSPGSPFPFPTPSASGPAASPPFPTAPPSRPATSPSPATYQSAVTIDTTATATKVEAPPATDVKDNTEPKRPKKYAFVDVSPEGTLQRSPFAESEETDQSDSSKDDEFADKVSQNGASSRPVVGAASEWSSSAGKTSSVLSVEDLERMMEDPTVQKMVYPYLPVEMRNPTTFKSMLQNPQYRQQTEEMLNNILESTESDNRMLASFKNLDLSSPEVKQHFDQIGVTPEEVVSKVMANPDVVNAFQNPRVQAALMECSQNPLSITKYHNDKEVMDVLNKVLELFPGMTGS